MKYLIAIVALLLATVGSAIYIMPEMPSEPGPTPRLLLVFGSWHQSTNICLTDIPADCPSSGPMWNIDYEAFNSIDEVGESLTQYWRSWPQREILGLWELNESNRIPIKQWRTTEIIEKHIEVEKHVLTTDHYKIGTEEFSGEPG